MIAALRRGAQALLPGFPGLFHKECTRFLSVSIQTVFGPVLASLLFLIVFAHVLEGRAAAFQGVSYALFLVPGLAAMTMIQQAFANASSSLIISKMMGNLVMILLTPITPFAFFLAYLMASLLRGVIVALLMIAAGALLVDIKLEHPLWMLAFLISGGLFSSALGVAIGIWAEKFDQIALFQTVLLLPLTFLSGVFYSLETLPPLWRFLSKLNPFTYYIDGFRYGFVGTADIPVWNSLLITLLFAGGVSLIGYLMIKNGYKIKN